MMMELMRKSQNLDLIHANGAGLSIVTRELQVASLVDMAEKQR